MATSVVRAQLSGVRILALCARSAVAGDVPEAVWCAAFVQLVDGAAAAHAELALWGAAAGPQPAVYRGGRICQRLEAAPSYLAALVDVIETAVLTVAALSAHVARCSRPPHAWRSTFTALLRVLPAAMESLASPETASNIERSLVDTAARLFVVDEETDEVPATPLAHEADADEAPLTDPHAAAALRAHAVSLRAYVSEDLLPAVLVALERPGGHVATRTAASRLVLALARHGHEERALCADAFGAATRTLAAALPDNGEVDVLLASAVTCLAANPRARWAGGHLSTLRANLELPAAAAGQRSRVAVLLELVAAASHLAERGKRFRRALGELRFEVPLVHIAARAQRWAGNQLPLIESCVSVMWQLVSW